jgi:predicted transcriptional regulator
MGSGVLGSAKQRVVDLVGDLPEDSSFDEILKELAFANMVERGLADVDAGRVVAHEEVLREIERWEN